MAAVAGCGGSKTTSTTTAATLGPTTTAPTTTAPTTAPTTTAKSAGATVTYGSMRTPAWSPDGTQIAWAEFSGAEGRIWLASSNGSNAHPVTQRIDALFQVAWLPGDQFLYDANFRLFRLPLKSLRAVRFGSGIYFSTNPAGTISAWAAADDCPQCYGPVNVRALSGGPTTSLGGAKVQNGAPTIAPDGRSVAFQRFFLDKASGEYSQGGGIWVSSTSGGPLKQIVSGGACPDWSPDGRQIAYVDGSNLRLVAPGGGPSTLLLRRRATCDLEFPPTWSPDSGNVAIVDNLGRLLIVNVATRRARVVTNTAIGSVGGFAWSPDSTKLLVTAEAKTTSCTLWAVTTSGSATALRRTC